MSINHSIHQKQRKANLLLHLTVLILVIVIDLPSSAPWAMSAYEAIGYTVSRIFPLLVFYACYFWLVPVYLARNKIVAFIIALLILVNVVTVIGYTILQLIHVGMFHEHFHLFYKLKMHLSGMTAMIIASIFGIAFRTATGWNDEIQKRSLLEQEKLRSELMLLKAQVNPHFLFNTLNTIDFLIYSDQTKASASLIKLSSLLRYVIYDTVKDLVPLQQEIEQMEAYIDLHRLRYGGEASISYERTGDPSGKTIAPMLFIPFIENAFKHSDEEGIRKGLKIGFKIIGDTIEFSSMNHLPRTRVEQQGGIGLENIRKRLEMQYPGKFELDTREEDELYKVTLMLRQV